MKKTLLCLLGICLFCSAQAEERMVIADQQELWTEAFGTLEDDNAVLFIHGCGSHAYFWDDFLISQFIEAGYFVIRYDQRHIGLSDPSYEKFDFIDLAADAIAILDDYGIDRVHLVGHSMGGMTSQFIAANYPERLHTMTLMSTAPVGLTPALEKTLTWHELKLSAKAAVYLTAPLPSDYEKALPLYLWGAEFFNGDYDVDEQMATDYIHKQYYRTRHPFGEGSSMHANLVFEMMRTLDERADIFHCIDTPTLIIHGEKDALILDTRGGIALHEAIQDSTLKLFPKMGHAIFDKELITEICTCIMDYLGQYREMYHTY